MNIIIDAFLIAILLFTSLAGYKNGFVKTVISFLKNIIALIAAGFYSERVGGFLYEKVFKGVFENVTLEKFAEFLGVDTTKNLDVAPLIENKHPEFMKYVENLGIDTEALESIGDSAGELVAEYISGPLGMTVSRVAAFILIFIASVIVINIVGFIVGKIVKLPILNATNKVLGLFLGIILGVIFVFIAVAILDQLLPYVKVSGEVLGSADFKDSTIVYSYLSSRSPMGLLEELILK